MTTTIKLYLEYQVEQFDASQEYSRIEALASIYPGARLKCNGLRAITASGDVAHESFGSRAPKPAPPSMPLGHMTVTTVEEDDDPVHIAVAEALDEALEPGAAKQPLYDNPDHYREQTGKRFRMTKEQRDRGLSRGNAFDEFIKENDHYEVDN